MRVLVDDQMFSCQAWRAEFTALVLMVIQRWPQHRVICTDRNREGRDGWFAWLTSGINDGGHLQNEIEESMGRWAREDSEANEGRSERASLQLRPHGLPTWGHFPHQSVELTPDVALHILSLPFEIWVENAVYDREFLLRALPPEKVRWVEMMEVKGAIRFVHAGGNSMIERRAASLRDRTNGSSLPMRMRTLLIMDSDRRTPSTRPSIEAQNLKRDAENAGIAFWVWKRRAIENYLPATVLRRFAVKLPQGRTLIQAWTELSEEQRHVVNMKYGIAQDFEYRGPQQQKIHNYWQALSSATTVGFGGGFGDRLARSEMERRRERIDWDDSAVEEFAKLVLLLEESI